MKLLLIASDNFTIPEIPHFIPELFTPTKNLEDDIICIKKIKANLIIIPAEQSTSYLESFLFGGLELLLWLRIKGVDTHIVITSFFSLQSVLQKTKLGFILGSKGVSFHQLPKHTANGYFENLVEDKAEPKNLKSYLSSIFDITQFRHAYANVWGLKRLVEVHNEINKKQFGLEKYIKPSELSLNFHIALYYYKHNNDHLTYSQGICLNKLSLKLKNINDINIIYIDDKAEIGYTDFLKSLFNESCEIIPIKIEERDNEQKLYNKFENIWHNKKGKIDFIISDLRLFPNEEQLTNYKDFISIKLMYKIFDKREEKRLKFEKLKYLLFTASNQFFNFKNAFKKNKYAPSDIFVKEGFDNSVIPNHKYKNYEHLLSSLIDLSKSKYRSKILSFGKNDEEFNDTKDNFLNNFIFDTWKKDYEKISSVLNKYEFVILDSNIFLVQKPIIPIYCNNIVISYPVFEELKRIERIVDKGNESYIFEYSKWFTDNYSGLVQDECLSHNSVNTIDSLLKNGYKEVADEYFVEIIEYYQNVLDSKEKILFLSNDTTDKENNFNKKSPVTLVKEWVLSNNIENVDIATFRNDEIKILNQQISCIQYNNYDFIKLSFDNNYILLKQKGIREQMCVHLNKNKLGEIISKKGVGIMDNLNLSALMSPYPKWVTIENYGYLKISFNSVLKLIS